MTEKFIDIYKRCKCCKYSVHEYQFPYKGKSKTVRDFSKCLSCVDQCTGRGCSIRKQGK